MTLSKNMNDLIVWVIIYAFSNTIRISAIINDNTISRDGSMYLSQAERWFDLQNYSLALKSEIIVPPLPLWSIKSLMSFGFNSEVCARSLSYYFGFLLLVVIYCTANMLFRNKGISFFAVLLFYLNPNIILYSIEPLREIYYLFFFSIIVFYSISLNRAIKLYYFLIVSLSIAAAIMCRFESIEFLILFIIYNAFIYFNAEKKHTMRLYALICCLTIPVFLFALNNAFECGDILIMNFFNRVCSILQG